MTDKVYWDSNCFLCLLQEEAGAPRCDQVLQDAQDGKIIIVTSSLTLAEVLKMKGKVPIPKEQQDTVVNFFLSEYIVVRNATRKTSELARDLIWNHGIDFKDAIHVASALENKLTMMHTFDNGLIRKSGLVGTPRLIISEPFVNEPRLALTVVTGGKK
jgi:predicted nucleic acid-binding protein